MDDVFVSEPVKFLLDKLISAAFKEISLVWGLKDELERLERTLLPIQAVLHDAEAKQRNSKDINQWLMELKDALYDAENIIDRVATEGLSQQMDLERGKYLKYAIRSIVNKLPRRISIAHKVKGINKKIDALADEKSKFHLSEVISASPVSESRKTSSLVNELEVYGRNEEKDLIVEKILNVSHEQTDLVIYALCGMGGIGKTTLAQLVYNDDSVKNHFELRVWVCVSDDFSAKRLTKAIIESIDELPRNVQELDALQRHLQEKLRGRRYLLVLDDVWSEDHNEWDKLKEALRCGSTGSVVIVTTRSEKVAIMMGSIQTYHLQCLSDDNSWSLFRRRAFSNREEDENLVEIGKKIMRKCGGVPLAVKALGSLMRFKSTENEWEAIQNSEIWQLSDKENRILPALRLSYDNLPHHLKQCFAYCCIFPKDYDMEKNELIQLWMANGFIASQDHKNLAQTGREIFQELVWRSFFQDVREATYRWGGVRWGHTVCKMHDLMHDLAQSVMGHETFIMEYNSNVPKNLKMLRHLSFAKGRASLKLSNIVSLRSFFMHPESITSKKYLHSVLSNQKYLRALKLQNGFSDYVFKLQLLRHLVLDVDERRSLPESLTHLYNLQSLKLERSGFLRELPKDLKYLKNLYLLEMDHLWSLVSTPPDLGELKYLQTLTTFIVGKDPSHQLHQLKDLDLEGELLIQGLYYVRNFEDAKSANLIAKKNLISLELEWKIFGLDIKNRDLVYPIMEGLFDEVLEGLQPNQNLKEIRIRNFPGSRLPKWLSSSHLKNLKKIHFLDCPLLEERCMKPNGEEWHKISHIPEIRINLQTIQSLDG